MSDRWLEREVSASLAKAKDASAPDFDESMRRAELALANESRRRRFAAGLCGLAAAILVAILLPDTSTDDPLPELAIEESLMSVTLWRAPSDSLIPNRLIDVYEPPGPLSTDLLEGTLL